MRALYIQILSLFWIWSFDSCNAQSETEITLRGIPHNGAFGRNGVYWLEVLDPQKINQRNSKVTSIELTENKEKIDYLAEVAFEKLEVFFLPKFGAFKAKLVKLSIVKSKLKEIHRTDLEQFENLEILWLQRNELKTIHSSLFESNPKLKEIDLRENQIWLIEQDTFKNLNALKKVSLAKNVCIKKDPRSDAINDEVNHQCSQMDQIMGFFKKNIKESEQCKDGNKNLKREIEMLNERVEHSKFDLTAQIKEREKKLNMENENQRKQVQALDDSIEKGKIITTNQIEKQILDIYKLDGKMQDLKKKLEENSQEIHKKLNVSDNLSSNLLATIEEIFQSIASGQIDQSFTELLQSRMKSKVKANDVTQELKNTQGSDNFVSISTFLMAFLSVLIFKISTVVILFVCIKRKPQKNEIESKTVHYQKEITQAPIVPQNETYNEDSAIYDYPRFVQRSESQEACGNVLYEEI